MNGANSDSPTYSIGEEFIYTLDAAVLSTRQSYNFVVTENQIFAVTNNAAVEAIKYDMMPINNESQRTIQTYAPMDTLVSAGATNWRWMTTSGTSYKITSGGTTYAYKYTVTPNGI